MLNDEIRRQFLDEYFYWEQQWINTPDASLNPVAFTTVDGNNLDYITGKIITNHTGSAASKEALHFMYLVHYINDSNFNNLTKQFNIINTKLSAFNKFNEQYPGFGGYIPWFTLNKQNEIIPSSGWIDKTPALDNGEMYWSLYALKWIILTNYNIIKSKNLNLNINKTLNYIERQLNLMEINAKIMFYDHNGLIRWTTYIGNTSLSPNDPKQTYNGSSRSGDPYEGELFQWLLDLKSNWNESNNDNPNDIWNAAIAHLYAINYTFSDKNEKKIVNITVQKGWHFSSHEQWKLFNLPYLDNELMYTVFENCEKVRTLNSVFGSNGNIGAIPGMYVDVASPIANYSDKGSYLTCGIPSIADGATYVYDTVAPYSTMTTWFFNESIAASWLLNMIKGPAMQSIYGTIKSIFVNGTEICPEVGWDAKMTTYIGAKGGVSKWTSYGLKQEGLYDRFINVMNKQYSKIFGTDSNAIKTNHQWGTPDVTIPIQYLNDFTSCS